MSRPWGRLRGVLAPAVVAEKTTRLMARKAHPAEQKEPMGSIGSLGQIVMGKGMARRRQPTSCGLQGALRATRCTPAQAPHARLAKAPLESLK